MILSRLDLTAFGRFTDVSLDLSAGPRRFHLIYGPNESGKSTSLRAITSLLFGMPHTAEDCFVHRNDKVRVGGLLVDPVTGHSLECVRRRGRKATLRDARDKEPVDESQLESMLGGINRETFLARFGLSYEALVEGGAAILNGNGDLGQILFAAGAGVGSLREIQSELDEAASKLFLSRGSKATINVALRSLDEDRKALRQAQVPTSEFTMLREQLRAKQQEAESLDLSLRQCAVELTRREGFQQALPLLAPWRAANEAISQLGDAPNLDDGFTERRRQVTADREIAVSRQKELETRIGELATRLDALGCDPEVMARESEIQTVFQQIAAREKADQERRALLRSQQDLDQEITALLKQRAVDVEQDDPADTAQKIADSIARLHVSDALRARIRDLAAAHAGLISRRNDASDLVETNRRRLADATQELEACGEIGEPSLLASAIESIGNPESELEAFVTSRQTCETIRRRCETMLQRLEGFEGDLDQAVRLALPNDASVRQLAEALRVALHQVGHQESLLTELQSQRDSLQQQLLEAQAERALPTVSELEAARHDRDRITDRLADGIRSKKIEIRDLESLRVQIQQVDQLADTMREYSDQVHRREMLHGQLRGLDAKLEEAKQSLGSAHASFETAKSDWESAWRSCQVKAGQPEAMQQWLAHHAKLCEWMDQLESEEQRLEKIQGRIHRAARRLRTVLASVDSGQPIATATAYQAELFDEPADDDLVALYDEAVALRSQWTQQRQQYEAIRRRRDELAEELPKAETRFEAAQAAVQDWHEDWRRLTESFVTSERAGTAEVLQMLEQISQLSNLKRERDRVVARLHAIDEDADSYQHRVRDLAEAIGHEIRQRQAPADIAHTMYQRLQAERSAAKTRETLQEQIESSRQRLSAALSQKKECDLILGQLCNEAGCDSPDELPSIERLAKERSELQSTLRDLERQLLRLAGDQPLPLFIDEASRQQPAVLALEIEREQTRQSELKQQVEAVQREIGAVQNELRRIDGGSRASDLAQSIQMMAGAIRSDVETYARLKIGALMLKRAIEHYRQQNQSPVLALANQYFRQLTCGEYVELKPDYDAGGTSTLFGVNAAGDSVPVSGMSTGTADALYLALRLASLQHQMKDGRAVPVVIDDCLIQLDDTRATAALQAFSDLSEKTQVILFTHHQHLRQLAEQHLGAGNFHLHQLGG